MQDRETCQRGTVLWKANALNLLQVELVIRAPLFIWCMNDNI